MFFRPVFLFLFLFLNKILFFSEHKEPMFIPLNTFLNLDLFFSIIMMEGSLQMLHGYMTLFLGLGSNDPLHVGVHL